MFGNFQRLQKDISNQAYLEDKDLKE